MMTSTSLPTAVSATTRDRSFGSLMSLPSNLITTSPGSMPAGFAGPLSSTPAIKAPRAGLMLRLSAISSVTVWMRTPSQPRRSSPNCRNESTTPATVFDGTAKPMPIEPPEGEMISVLTPITSPARLNSGPPELPRLMAASVWM